MKCPTCSGTGRIAGPDYRAGRDAGDIESCGHCDGAGVLCWCGDPADYPDLEMCVDHARAFEAEGFES